MSAGEHPLPPPGEHGGDGDTVARALGVPPHEILDLSASLNPVAPCVTSIVAAHLDALGRYPDVEGPTRSLAAAIGMAPDRLVLTNGGAEAIALVARLEPVGRVDHPEFSLYERHLATVSPDGPRWRSNPHNPSGALAGSDDGAAVWDEAFYPLATGTWSRGDNTWRLGSLTKLWACPGLRLGYVIAPDAERARAIRRLQPEWPVNGLALAAMDDLLAMTDLPGWAAQVRELRCELVGELRRRGLTVTDTEANWILVHDMPLRELLAPQGVVVRDCSSFGLSATTRIAVPRPGDLPRLLAAIDTALDPPRSP